VRWRPREKDFGTTTMTGRWFGSGMRDQLRSHERPGWIDWKASITTLPVRTFCGMRKSDLGEETTAVCRTVSKSTASQLCLRSVASQVAIGSGTRKMFMPKQKLHTHEEVFKDHVSGQYDETIFRFRVPGGWIYTHTIIRFGSVDKNYVADTFVPDSTVDMDLPIRPTDDPRRNL
jgi:hypothetical protein